MIDEPTPDREETHRDRRDALEIHGEQVVVDK